MLQNLGVTFGPLDAARGQAGDFFVTTPYPRPFGGFGQTVLDDQRNPRVLSNFTYVVADDAPIVAAVDGVISLVTARDPMATPTDDALLLRTSDRATWFVNDDHMTNLQVGEKFLVHAGQVVAHPMRMSSRKSASRSR